MCEQPFYERPPYEPPRHEILRLGGRTIIYVRVWEIWKDTRMQHGKAIINECIVPVFRRPEAQAWELELSV